MSNKPVILVVDDEPSLRDLLVLNLSLEGYEVLTASNGREGVDIIKKNKVNLIIMDVMMPQLDGVAATKMVKALRPDIPLILLSALSNPSERINGLKAGADDYLNKPFSYEELLIRIQLQLKKSNHQSIHLCKIGNLTFDVNQAILKSDTKVIDLSDKLNDLLSYLVNNKYRVVSRQELMSNVWQYDHLPENSRTIDNYVVKLRKVIRSLDVEENYIISVRGKGYQLVDHR